MKYVAPQFGERAFNCPHCGVLAPQTWADLYLAENAVKPKDNIFIPTHRDALPMYKTLDLSVCAHCRQECIWHNRRLFYPSVEGVEPPNADLGEEIREDYLEAASIVQRSPRGAVALLRLCVQKLCRQLGKPGKNINDDIAALVKEGLPVMIQQSLDALRVVGNNAVHPGELDLKDDVGTALTLFGQINLIADNRISEPKRIEAVYLTLPEAQREAIEKRDGKALAAVTSS
jgi:hypothetical protein